MSYLVKVLSSPLQQNLQIKILEDEKRGVIFDTNKGEIVAHIIFSDRYDDTIEQCINALGDWVIADLTMVGARKLD